ncbi:hypothetical protein ELE36_11040 [Pseudolysobacter antarcticus]|uniref:DUF7452 domain-containing protein n=1 Tax=Pseudolysobacter antarcticus TaxID=2511995 RepID=A0A411HJX9_9GAMM|nr:choice-of-anchor Q domain-containing protein [Pseudolysobacter antarcticus]QBB70846.1 hypothetical protein ELE36_11040 [Pseudolysobacter antarcticus]
MSSRLSVFFLALVTLPITANAVVRTWPGTAPCTGTLQACIDGATNGDEIRIATNTAIAEDISLYDRSLTLSGADGYTAAFGSGHWLSITSSSIAGNLQISVSRLNFTDGYVFSNYNGTGTATYDLRELNLTRVGSDVYNFIELDANHGTVNATIYNNRVSGVPSSLNRGLIHVSNSGAVLNASVYFNHVTSSSASSVSGAGIFVDEIAAGGTGASGTVKLHGNEVRGGFFRSGIYVSEGLFSSTVSSYSARVYNNVVICNDASSAGTGGSGIGFVVNNGTISAQAINNTVSRCYHGISASQWSGGGGSASITGLINNNVIAAYSGIDMVATLIGPLTNDYNLINATTSSVGYGAHTITAPAKLVLDTQPRLLADSPAINAADGATLGFGLILNGLPVTDADGLRRYKGTPANPDIGAYEYGDVSFTHVTSSANNSSNYSLMDNAALDANPAAALIATPNYNIGVSSGGTSYPHAFGAFYTSPSWALFNQDFATPMAASVHFDVWAPAVGGGSFTHVTSASTASGFGTTISDGSTDNLPDRIVLVTQNWSAGGASLYNPHPVGVYYGGSKWHIANIDGATMPQPLGFNVYSQEASPNAWRVTASSGNLSGSSVQLRHPLLDNIPCARPHVTRLLGAGLVSDQFDVDYNGAYWYIFGYSGIAVSEQFHVLVDPAQIFDCTDRIFANGFQ